MYSISMLQELHKLIPHAKDFALKIAVLGFQLYLICYGSALVFCFTVDVINRLFGNPSPIDWWGVMDQLPGVWLVQIMWEQLSPVI